MNHTPESPQDTRQRLLVAAIISFADKGFKGTSIREIAQLAKANSALVQYYFGSKEGLYEAALSFLFEHPHQAVRMLPPPPQPGEPEARPRALQHLKDFIRAFLSEACLPEGCADMTEELHRAAHLFWTRELMDPVPERRHIMENHIQPYVNHVDSCLRVLCPHLDQEALHLNTCAIISQIAFFHQHRVTVAVFRGRPYGPEDVDMLTAHVTTFSLRGLGLESVAADPTQDA